MVRRPASISLELDSRGSRETSFVCRKTMGRERMMLESVIVQSDWLMHGSLSVKFLTLTGFWGNFGKFQEL